MTYDSGESFRRGIVAVACGGTDRPMVSVGTGVVCFSW